MPFLGLAFLFFVSRFCEANVVLTYPQARFPPLDFLPTELTLPPCGVPKPTKPFYTDLRIGEAYNVTWISPSVLNASYHIRLIDSDGITVEDVPISSDATSAQSISLKTPCEQCMLVVEQTQKNGKSFRSCSDVNVISASNSKENFCGQQGSLMKNKCQCDSGYTGNRCQYYAHCELDSDCMNGGKCVDQSDSLIRKRCYCAYGYFGQRCDRKFNSQNDVCFAYDELAVNQLPRYGMFNSDCYVQHDLSADDHIYSRQIENEVEVILDFKTTSWASLGWRPTELSTSCRLFPILEDTRGKPTQMNMVDRREFVAKPVMPDNNGFAEIGLKAPLHAMDCVDIVMGSVKNGRALISDFYSRDRSTPLEDYWYEGEMSLSASYGIEVDGRTIIMFRRETREFEPTDHPLGPNEVFTVWAKGGKLSGDSFKYHGINRGVERLKLAEIVNVTIKPTTMSNELAFGVKNVAQNRLDPMLFPTTLLPSSIINTNPTVETTTPITTTSTKMPDSSTTSTLSIVFVPVIWWFLI
ncbi:unnamed protein product [Caenorhabditis bovis]|uniref:EGF-like domain-containing protein n=1 Tax=Caenorhabditis bovis TaxID=2654633 RepID=A0A8S1EW80_9PELO|nr:unnamed protein product [Caenorhabditis bovis]